MLGTLSLYACLIDVFALTTFAIRGPQFIKVPSPRVKFPIFNGTELSCIADGQPVPKVIWVTDQGQPLQNTSQYYQRSHADGESTLVFRPVGDGDRNAYRWSVLSPFQCNATNEVGKIVSGAIFVEPVDMKPTTVETFDVDVERGSTAVLPCILSSDSPKHEFVVDTWVMTEKLVKAYLKVSDHYTRGKLTYTVLYSGELILFDVTSDIASSRSFACQLRHKYTGKVVTSKREARAIIRDIGEPASPTMTLIHPQVTIVDGTSTKLPCVAQGTPAPTYRWYKEVSGKLTRVESEDSRVCVLHGILLFSPANVSDSATYVCIATNIEGEVNATTHLAVAAQRSYEIYPMRQLRKLGEEATITCNTSHLHMYHFIWWKDGERLELQDEWDGPTHSVLRIHSVRFSDKGMYQCFSYNIWKHYRGSAELLIEESAPSITSMFSDTLAEIGENVSMKCVAMGNPLPNVTWHFNANMITTGERLLVENNYEVDLGEITSYLSITGATTDNGGQFSCLAENKVGSAVHSAMLNVDAQILMKPMNNVTAIVGTTVTLDCPHSGSPVQSIRWKKDGSALTMNKRISTRSGGSLSVQDLQMVTDEGKYECEVRGDSEKNMATGYTYLAVINKYCQRINGSDSSLGGEEATESCYPDEKITPSNTATKRFCLSNTVAILEVVSLFKGLLYFIN